MVTASDGRPTYATRKPLSAPSTAPRISVRIIAVSMETSCSLTSTPQNAAETPSVLATDRSISPVMMISVIGSAIIRIGAYSLARLYVVSGPSKNSTFTSE